MALVVADRVQETTSTTSTSDYVLLGAAAGYQSFGAVLANGDTTYYAITNDTDWEVGIGTYSTTGPTLARTTILASSSGGSAVSWGVGVKNIFISYAASKSVYLDASGNLSVADKIIHTGDTDTAIRFPAADTVSIETGGTERFKVENAAITTTVPVVLPADPTTSLQAATKSYVDTIASASIHYHTPVRVESPTPLTVTYNNGTAGVGATLTNAGAQAALALDGVTLSVNDRVLIYTQVDQTQNGVYDVTSVGSGSTNWVLTRSDDTDTYGASSPTALGAGDAFFVSQGATGAGELYVCNTTGTITFGTTNITFVQVAATAVYTAGTGISVTNNVITNTAPDQTVALTQGGATTITGTYPNFTISSTDTTYTAGGGIGLTGTTFSVAAGTGLTQDADGLSHADTSSQTSVDNTGAVFIQDVSLDGFGHVTSLASTTITPALIGAATAASPVLTGQVSLDDGSASAPSLTNTGDLNTGLFFPAEDTVGLGTGGTERMRIDASGNVGIGVTPSAWASFTALQIDTNGSLAANDFGTDNAQLILGNNLFYDGLYKYLATGAKATRYQQSAGSHLFYTAPSGTAGNAITFTQAMTLDASGNLGIGTTSPATKLDVNGSVLSTGLTTDGTGAAGFDVQSNRANSGQARASFYVFGPNNTTSYQALRANYAGIYSAHADIALNADTSKTIQFWTGGTERARIDASGNVGIGTSSPVTRAEIAVANAALQTALSLTNKVNYASGRGAAIAFRVPLDTPYTTDYAGGRIGSTSEGGTGVGDSNLVFETAAGQTLSERMRITSAGNVGIGDVSPDKRLVVYSPSSPDVMVLSHATTTTDTQGATLLFRNESSSGSLAGAEIGYRTGSAIDRGSLIFSTSAASNSPAERMRIDSSGNVGIGTSSPSQPLTVAGNIYVNGADGEGLIFNGSMGIFRASSTSLAFNTGGAERARIDGSGGLSLASGTGVTTTADNDGTFSSGTYTPTPAGGNMKVITNGGAFTFAAPSAAGDYTLVVLVMNSATAGAITLSGFNRTVGDAFTTTNGSEFLVNITKINGHTLANVVAMQ